MAGSYLVFAAHDGPSPSVLEHQFHGSLEPGLDVGIVMSIDGAIFVLYSSEPLPEGFLVSGLVPVLPGCLDSQLSIVD